MHDLIAEAAGRASVHGEPLLQRREPQPHGHRGRARATAAWPAPSTRSVLRRSLEEARGTRRGAGARLVRRRQARGRHAPLPRRSIWCEAWTGFTDSPAYADAEQIANRLIDDYVEGEVDRVLMVYNHFDSPLLQTRRREQLLPVPIGELEELSARELALQGTLLFEPDEEDMLGDLLRTAVETAVFRALLESTASEHGARMTAMRNASDNANDLIDRLTLAMNRARQAEITQEILEVVAGADALE